MSEPDDGVEPGPAGEDVRPGPPFDASGAVFWSEVWPFKDDSDGSTIAFGEVRVATDGATPPAPGGTPEGESPVVDEPTPLPVRPAARPAPPDPLPPFAGWERTSSRRRVLVAVAVGTALVVTAGMGWIWMRRGGDDAGEAVRASDRTFAAPVALAPGSSYVRSRVLRSGEVEVTHWIRTRSLLDTVTLRIPTTEGLAATAVSVAHVTLAVNGAPYPAIPASRVGGRSQTFLFPETHSIYLRYRLSGVTQANGPGGRALARITSLDLVPASGPMAVTQVVSGARVLALACTSGAPDTQAIPCGSVVGGSWRVSLTGDERPTRVMAQVDLSGPRS